MKCVVCKVGETAPGTFTETYDSGVALVVVRGIPGEVCGACGAGFTDVATTSELQDLVRAAREAGSVVIREFSVPTSAST